MNKTDALVAAIGAGVLVVALAGAALTGTGAGTSYGVTWTDNSAEHDLGGQTAQQSGELEFAYDNPHANTTALHFSIAATVGQGALGANPSTFTVEVTGPDGQTGTGEGTIAGGPTGGTGAATVDITVGSAPTTTSATGASPGAAAAALASTATNTTGQGNWTVIVQFTNNAVAPNLQYTFAASVEVHWYSAEVAAVVPTAR